MSFNGTNRCSWWKAIKLHQSFHWTSFWPGFITVTVSYLFSKLLQMLLSLRLSLINVLYTFPPCACYIYYPLHNPLPTLLPNCYRSWGPRHEIWSIRLVRILDLTLYWLKLFLSVWNSIPYQVNKTLWDHELFEDINIIRTQSKEKERELELVTVPIRLCKNEACLRTSAPVKPNQQNWKF